MHLVEHVLARHFLDEGWRISTPPAGTQKEAYIAESSQRRLFVKFDTATPAWQRLAAIGVTPPLLASGVLRGRPYVVQAFADGTHPDRAWFGRNIAPLAQFVRRYQDDAPLRVVLVSPDTSSHAAHVQYELNTLRHALGAASPGRFSTDRFRVLFRAFEAQAARLPPVTLVPIHADPSPVNMLVTAQGLTMLDWDEVMLSDPMRDVGLIVWWYLPPRHWQAFFDAYAAPLERDTIFWWVARRSLGLALWLDARQAPAPAHAFLEDFYRAAQHQNNPQTAGP